MHGGRTNWWVRRKGSKASPLMGATCDGVCDDGG